MNLVDVVCLLDVFEEFLYISFGKETGKKLYTDYTCWIRLPPEEKEKSKDGEITYDFSRMEMAFNVMIWIVITNKINFGAVPDNAKMCYVGWYEEESNK